MSLKVNLRQLDNSSSNVQLTGTATAEELDLVLGDELIQVKDPVRYELEISKQEEGILVQGKINMLLRCECARCLKAFEQPLDMEDYACFIALEGEEAVAVDNDCVDLTAPIREDILLGFPQHPLCEMDCRGLAKKSPAKEMESSGARQSQEASSAWSELNKLKF